MQKVQNFRANAGPFRPTLEKNVWNNFDLESSQLSKNVRNLKIWHILAFWTTLGMVIGTSSIPGLVVDLMTCYCCAINQQSFKVSQKW